MSLHERPPIVLAVVGAGSWGKNLVRNFAHLPSVELRYVCDRRPAVQSAIAAQHPAVRVVSEMEIVLSDPEVHGVVIATEAPTHAALAQQALEAGKDVFVEKPLTLTSHEGLSLCRRAEEEGRILMVGHLLLYHPAIEALQRAAGNGELGELLYLSSQRLNLGIVRREENAFWSLAPHDISVANALFGAAPIAVSATGGAYLQAERGIEDVVFATLFYPEGKVAHIHVSWLDPHKTRALTVVGSRKMAVFDDGSDRKLAIFDKGAELPLPDRREDPVRLRSGEGSCVDLPSIEPLRRECEAFVEAIHTRARPLADGWSGLAVVRVLEAATSSLRANGRPVSLEGSS